MNQMKKQTPRRQVATRADPKIQPLHKSQIKPEARPMWWLVLKLHRLLRKICPSSRSLSSSCTSRGAGCRRLDSRLIFWNG